MHITTHPHWLLRFLAWVLPVAVLLMTVHPSWALYSDRSVVVRQVGQEYGQRSVLRVERWFSMLEHHADENDSLALLATVNDFWNRYIQEADDHDIWQQEDYWATPLETLVRGKGDCEDFVIGKYFSLVSLGVPPDKLRLIYVRAQVGGQSIAHMVLGYYPHPHADPFILDNLVHTIRPAVQRTDLIPVFSFNADGIYIAGAAASITQVSRWQGLLSRMRQEGFLCLC